MKRAIVYQHVVVPFSEVLGEESSVNFKIEESPIGPVKVYYASVDGQSTWLGFYTTVANLVEILSNSAKVEELELENTLKHLKELRISANEAETKGMLPTNYKKVCVLVLGKNLSMNDDPVDEVSYDKFINILTLLHPFCFNLYLVTDNHYVSPRTVEMLEKALPNLRVHISLLAITQLLNTLINASKNPQVNKINTLDEAEIVEKAGTRVPASMES